MPFAVGLNRDADALGAELGERGTVVRVQDAFAGRLADRVQRGPFRDGQNVVRIFVFRDPLENRGAFGGGSRAPIGECFLRNLAVSHAASSRLWGRPNKKESLPVKGWLSLCLLSGRLTRSVLGNPGP